ncbi:hypothetical protein [Hydrogenimonas urashimensis]|nr:hypothetical protein [Hydrogenimonas urashimensis]
MVDLADSAHVLEEKAKKIALNTKGTDAIIENYAKRNDMTFE